MINTAGVPKAQTRPTVAPKAPKTKSNKALKTHQKSYTAKHTPKAIKSLLKIYP